MQGSCERLLFYLTHKRQKHRLNILCLHLKLFPLQELCQDTQDFFEPQKNGAHRMPANDNDQENWQMSPACTYTAINVFCHIMTDVTTKTFLCRVMESICGKDKTSMASWQPGWPGMFCLVRKNLNHWTSWHADHAMDLGVKLHFCTAFPNWHIFGHNSVAIETHWWESLQRDALVACRHSVLVLNVERKLSCLCSCLSWQNIVVEVKQLKFVTSFVLTCRKWENRSRNCLIQLGWHQWQTAWLFRQPGQFRTAKVLFHVPHQVQTKQISSLVVAFTVSLWERPCIRIQVVEEPTHLTWRAYEFLQVPWLELETNLSALLSGCVFFAGTFWDDVRVSSCRFDWTTEVNRITSGCSGQARRQVLCRRMALRETSEITKSHFHKIQTAIVQATLSAQICVFVCRDVLKTSGPRQNDSELETGLQKRQNVTVCSEIRRLLWKYLLPRCQQTRNSETRVSWEKHKTYVSCTFFFFFFFCCADCEFGLDREHNGQWISRISAQLHLMRQVEQIVENRPSLPIAEFTSGCMKLVIDWTHSPHIFFNFIAHIIHRGWCTCGTSNWTSERASSDFFISTVTRGHNTADWTLLGYSFS